jgi:hypothetical protein
LEGLFRFLKENVMAQRAIHYAVIEAERLRQINPMTDHEIIAAQKNVTADMIQALEQMVNAAKAGTLHGEAVLALRAAAWKGSLT